jgi:hypothetical protein
VYPIALALGVQQFPLNLGQVLELDYKPTITGVIPVLKRSADTAYDYYCSFVYSSQVTSLEIDYIVYHHQFTLTILREVGDSAGM